MSPYPNDAADRRKKIAMVIFLLTFIGLTALVMVVTRTHTKKLAKTTTTTTSCKLFGGKDIKPVKGLKSGLNGQSAVIVHGHQFVQIDYSLVGGPVLTALPSQYVDDVPSMDAGYTISDGCNSYGSPKVRVWPLSSLSVQIRDTHVFYPGGQLRP